MVPYVLPSNLQRETVAVREYVPPSGKSPFGDWFNELSGTAASKVVVALYRLQQGNFSNVKGVGAGVYEYKIDFGPGYRVYFGKDGDRIVILLGGSSKKRQSAAIAGAQSAWAAYKESKLKL
jgi:putative addiction module killer protein